MSDSWVCPECKLDYGTLHPPFAINAVKSFPRRFTEALEARSGEDNDSVIRQRPAEGVWSAIEYTAHVADLMPAFSVTIDRMNSQSDPDLSDVFFDPDEKVAAENANAQPKDDVLARLKAGCDGLVAVAERVNADSWSRTAQFPWGERDMLTMLQNAVHEGVHHLRDVEHGLAQVRGGA